MTRTCALFSLLKSLWLRGTGQPGWCDCIVCRDEMLNLPDPLGFSQDARKFQKQLRKVPKAYKCKPCIPTRDHHHNHHISNEETICDLFPTEESAPRHKKSSSIKHEQLLAQPSQPIKALKTVSFSDPLEQHRSPERDIASNGYSEGYAYIHESQMNESNEDKNGEWKSTSEIIRSLETRNEASTSSANQATEINHESTFNDENDYSLYEAHPPLKSHLSAKRLYNENDSIDSYGTITSQELLEAFEKAAEVSS
ncbi:hypothetical protein OESDEN_15405 [Oesophagostomum dentatum]|uniref:EF-hand domain-containing protein n=1 Tax=Oesophagostomum dentatum TaxID=61180 RepID=A0A0B1SNT6_OESDE|nr:hypothetical protein OESDEN_15405 [Oesophagostomum dentatum]